MPHLSCKVTTATSRNQNLRGGSQKLSHDENQPVRGSFAIISRLTSSWMKSISCLFPPWASGIIKSPVLVFRCFETIRSVSLTIIGHGTTINSLTVIYYATKRCLFLLTSPGNVRDSLLVVHERGRHNLSGVPGLLCLDRAIEAFPAADSWWGAMWTQTFPGNKDLAFCDSFFKLKKEEHIIMQKSG